MAEVETVVDYAGTRRGELETEIRQLRAAVFALREELELANVELRHKTQEVRSSYEAEMVQLRNTIASMRSAIELAAVEAEHAANAQITVTRDENKQLRETIQSMRAVNEEQRNSFQVERQELKMPRTTKSHI